MLGPKSFLSNCSIDMSDEIEQMGSPSLGRIFRRWADYVSSKVGENVFLKSYLLRPCFEPYFKEKDGGDIELMPLTKRGKNQNFRKKMLWMEKDSKHKIEYWFALGVVWTITLMLLFVRGGKGAESIFGVPFCGFAYWLVSFVAIVALAAVSMLTLRRLMHESEEKRLCGYQFAEGDVVWTKTTGIKLAMVTLIAGVIAGLIGIGGGMVVGPILLELGFNPQVSSALTATNVLMSSSTVSVLVLMSSAAPIDEALFFGCICFVGAYFGKNFLGKVIRRLGKTSVIIFILGGVIFLAIVAVIAQGILDIATHGIDFKFTNICS